MKRRVAVTGMGILCPIGNTVAEVMESVRAGRCGIRPITRYDTSNQRVKLAGEVRGFDPEGIIEPAEVRKLDRYSYYALCAACDAMKDAGWRAESLAAIDMERFGVILGTGIGGIETIEEMAERGRAKGYDRVSPFFIPKAISNMAAGNIALRYGLRGICLTDVTACASSANAIGDAFRQIRDGYMDRMIAGGAEASITPLCIGGFTAMKALTVSEDPHRASIPFDAERSGFVMGEGAAMLVLEEYELAKKRGANIYGEVAGYGVSCDAYHMTAPDPQAREAARCMKAALADARIKPLQVDYINAHGTSTKMNDACETLAIHLVWGEHAGKVKVSSTKSMTGHMLGASGAAEAVITLKCMEEGFYPPTVGYQKADEACDLNYLPGQGKKGEIGCAMSNSFGFGGHNVSLVFCRKTEQPDPVGEAGF